MNKELENINEPLNLNRTNELFEASIEKSNAYSTEPYDANSLRANNLTLKFGNLHLNTAKVKTRIQQLIGYRDNLGQMQTDVKRKVRRQVKR